MSEYETVAALYLERSNIILRTPNEINALESIVR